MSAPPVVALQFAFALTAYGMVAAWYVWPAIADRPLATALPPLLLVHLVRPISLWLLVPGVVVRETMPRAFAAGTAYGDLVAAVLALVALVLVRGSRKGAIVAVWVFNIVGLLDLLRNVVTGLMLRAPEHMGAAVFVPAYGVPLLLVSHILIFKLLRRPRG